MPDDPAAGAPAVVSPPPGILTMLHSGAVVTPQQCEEAIAAICIKIDQGTAVQAGIEEAARLAKLAYDGAYALAITRSEARSADRREAEARVATAELEAAMTAHVLKARLTEKAMHNLRSMLSGVQTIAKSVGASYSAANQSAHYQR